MTDRYINIFTDRPRKLQERVFDKFFNSAEIARFAPKEREAYEDSLKYYRDLKNSLDTAREEGETTGKLEGKIEGKPEGWGEFQFWRMIKMMKMIRENRLNFDLCYEDDF